MRSISCRAPVTLILSLAVLAALAGGAAAQGFHGEYYLGYHGYPRLPGPVAATRVDADLAFSDSGAPGTTPWRLPAGLGPDRYTVRWTATFTPPAAGAYGFTLECDDDGVLVIDGAVAIDLRGIHARRARSATVTLSAAPHFVELYYAEDGSESYVKLTSTPPGATAAQPIPPAQLRAGVAFGADVRRVTFDGIAAGTYLIDQLVGADGIRLASDHVAGNETYTTRPKVITQWPGFPAASAPNVLFNDSDGIEGYEPISSNVPLTIAFLRPQRRVALVAGSSVPVSSSGAPRFAVVAAHDAAGNLIASDRVDALPAGPGARLAVERGTADIATITIDYGSNVLGELIDDLQYETDASVVATVDGAAPVVTILTPTAGQIAYQPLGGVALRVQVRDASGVISSVIATGGGSPQTLFRVDVTDPACTPPTCAVYDGGPVAEQGPLRLVVTARDGAGNEGTAAVDLTVVRRTAILIVDENSRPVAGAELFVDGVRHRTVSDAAGSIVISPPLRAGASLVARAVVFENPAVRGSHAGGGTRDWSYRVYNTSQPVNLDGSVTPAVIANPVPAQTLRLDRQQSVIGLHVVVSVEWDASQAELDNLRDDHLQGASNWLYNATDGQMVIERVEMLDNARTWDDADFRVYTDWSLRANVNCRRAGFLGNSIWCGTWMHMSRSDEAWVYAHEFGHYGLDLGDEYTDDRGGLCTAALGGANPQFGMNAGKESCIMAARGVPKLCSHHGDNPHLDGTGQGATSCWTQVALRYRDEERARGFLQRWFIRTPTRRGGIVDRLAPMLTGWRVAAPALDNQARAGLCAPFPVALTRDDTGAPAGDVEVWLRTADGRSILEGKTSANANVAPIGTLTVTGVHVGDRLEVPGDSWTIGPGDCTPVAR